MHVLVSVLTLVVSGSPLSPAADNDAIHAALVAGDPSLTQPPTSLEDLVVAVEIAEEKLRRATDVDDVTDLLTLTAQGRKTAYRRSNDPLHLCRLIAASDHVLAQGAVTPGLSAAASDFRDGARVALGAETCAEAKPPPIILPSAAADDSVSPVQAPKFEPPDLPRAEQRDRRRARIGVGTLVPGLALFAPMIGLLVYRVDARRGLAELNAETATRPATDDEVTRVEALDRRYGATTAAAAVIGAAGGALVVTGAVLLATRGRPRRAALVPWGGRGVGGLVLVAKF